MLPETEKEISNFKMAHARRQWRIKRKGLFEYIEMNNVPSYQNLVNTFNNLVKSSTTKENWETMVDTPDVKVWFKVSVNVTVVESDFF